MEPACDYNQAALGAARTWTRVQQLFRTLVADEEAHFDAFDKQLDNISASGRTTWHASFQPSDEKSGGSTHARGGWARRPEDAAGFGG